MSGKNKKNAGSLIAGVCIVALLAASFLFMYYNSESKDVVDVSLDFYYVDKETSLIKPEMKQIRAQNDAELVEEALNLLKAPPKSESLTMAVPENISVLNIKLDNKVVTLDLSKEYSDMKSGEELFCRASIVWTLTGLNFVDGVRFFIEGQELCKTNGEPMGVMGRNDIVIDAVIQPEPVNAEVVTLYFSNADSTALLEEKRTIEVNPNQPIEKYIVEQLIAGPKESGHMATVPSETKIRDIKTVDGVCYVDLSEEFVTKHGGGSTGELLTIYSIVNSLTQLDTVDRVQFLIEGEKQNEYKGHLDFSKPFEAKEITG